MTNTQIDEMMYKHFQSQYQGIVTSEPKLEDMKEGDIYIVFDGPNHHGHWRAVYRKRGRAYQFDSFNRPLAGNRFISLRQANRQDEAAGDCGQRTIAFLKRVFPDGVATM